MRHYRVRGWHCCHLPPLRTVLAAFAAHGSSISNALFGGRGTATEVAAPLRYAFANNARCDWLASIRWNASQRLNAGSRQQRPKARLQVLDEFLFLASSSKSLVVKHHAEVSTVTRTVMSLAARPTQRLSRSLQSGIGFLRYLIPDLPWVFLTVDFPGSKKHLRRRPGLPRSASITGSVRSRLDAGGFVVHDAGITSLHTSHIPFGYSVTASYAALGMTARVRRFRCHDHTIHF